MFGYCIQYTLSIHGLLEIKFHSVFVSISNKFLFFLVFVNSKNIEHFSFVEMKLKKKNRTFNLIDGD